MDLTLPASSFFKAVPDTEDTFAFKYDFTLEGKAVDDGHRETVTVDEETGDLYIEGFAAIFEGEDRQGENFAPGSFQRGIKSFLEGTASLNYHHKHDHGIGKVLNLEETDKGLKMKARVDYQPESSPLRYIYNGVKKGTYSGLSVGGFFKRGYVEGKPRIVATDMTEISITPVPVHPSPSFGVIAGKALTSDLRGNDHVDVPNISESEIRDDDAMEIQYALDSLERVLERIARRKTNTDPAAD